MSATTAYIPSLTLVNANITTLTNSQTNFSGALVPTSDLIQVIGSASKRMNAIYANTVLCQNLQTFTGSDLTVNANLLPIVDAFLNLGSASNRWNYIYSDNILQVSDIKYKTNIIPLSNQLSNLKNINVYNFNYNDLAEKKLHKNKNKDNTGFIAQEVEKVYPDYVKNVDGDKFVDYTKFIPNLFQMVKEQQDIIEKLEKRISDLEK